mmetsp:Transcript_28802/g.37839  ORF Transcript_28802/g.37839 Transcript_28802/m.37839 type:complete len:150 (+) Transcript_28802:153-602(+)|eukprot:CAMPEP_0117759696 /NCGR_PEP_ID=MMETSP0947-20121206/16165_1 /TAXON_ID=44440 /ORGANISM="Chattonella subsalsa, Strain CCMP2191" /LENGTH=149 /DNA_ID=CAMNT_0005580199 /DNA_START=137 /DNA_END=586 /DNA_ORIENTATION=-
MNQYDKFSLRKRGILMTLGRLLGNDDPYAVPAIVRPKHGVAICQVKKNDGEGKDPLKSSTQHELILSDTVDFGHVIVSEDSPENEDSTTLDIENIKQEEEVIIPSMYDFEAQKNSLLQKLQQGDHQQGDNAPPPLQFINVKQKKNTQNT